MRIQLESGSSAILVKLACLVGGDKMGVRSQTRAIRSWESLIACPHLHFFPFRQDERLHQSERLMIWWWLGSFRRKPALIVHSVSVPPNVAIASLLVWWPICHAQAFVCSSLCMCRSSFVTPLTVAGKSLRNAFRLLLSPGRA